MAGLLGRVSKKRAKDPSLVGDEFIVLKAAPVAIGDLLDLAFFPASAEAQARSYAAMLQEQEKPEADRDAAVMATGAAAMAHVSVETLVKPSSLKTFCKGAGSGVEALLSAVSTASQPAPHQSTVVNIAEGDHFANLPVGVLDAKNRPSVIVLPTATATSPPDADGDVLVEDADGEEHLVRAVDAVAYKVKPVVRLRLDGVPADLLKIVKAMPLSAQGHLGAEDFAACEFLTMVQESGTQPLLVKRLADSLAGTGAWAELANCVMMQVVMDLNGKVLGSTWPSDPAALGVAIKERARAGVFPQLDKAEALRHFVDAGTR